MLEKNDFWNFMDDQYILGSPRELRGTSSEKPHKKKGTDFSIPRVNQLNTKICSLKPR